MDDTTTETKIETRLFKPSRIDRFTHWLEDLSITLEADGNTLLTGPSADQSVLYGLLKRVHQLGLQLISINKVEIEDSNTS